MRRFTPVLAFLALSLGLLSVLQYRYEPLVPGHLDELSVIVLSRREQWEQPRQQITLPPEEARQLFLDLVRLVARDVRHPDHSEAISGSPLYTLEVIYCDGTSDVIRTTESMGVLYRYTDTVGSSNDPGYVFARHTEAITAWFRQILP